MKFAVISASTVLSGQLTPQPQQGRVIAWLNDILLGEFVELDDATRAVAE